MGDSLSQERAQTGGAEDARVLVHWLERANQVASATHLDELLGRFLELMVDVCEAKGGLVCLLDPKEDELVCRATMGLAGAPGLLSQRASLETGIAGVTMRECKPILIEDLSTAQGQSIDLDELRAIAAENAFFYPLLMSGKPFGVLQLFDSSRPSFELVGLLCDRLAPDVHKAMLIDDITHRKDHLNGLISIFERIGATLDRDQILRMMVNYARESISAEASSLFLVDEATGENVLYLASNIDEGMSFEQMRVPPGKGIIGHVVQTGKTLLVPDVSRDARHYSGVDESSGFVTRAILAVPLHARQVNLGRGRGTIKEQVIGGFEAINKLEGTFDDHDAQLLLTLANQAATVVQIVDLYNDANDLFLDVIKALVTSIDAKDPYTEGHSHRVSEFSVEIARQLDLSAEEVHSVRIGSLLHDVGKIGIPDAILSKPGRLTESEFVVMRQHPSIGSRIMGQVRKLHDKLRALSEHHERLDGTGYPAGLKGDQVSMLGRIVAVADVFDAMTSDRPYRLGLPPEEVLDYLYKGVGTSFDGVCVDALAQVYAKGIVNTQKEREGMAGGARGNDQRLESGVL